MHIPTHAKVLLFMAVLFTGMAVLALFSVERLEHRAALGLAKQTSALLVNTMNLMRVSYSEEVVSKVREHTALSIGPKHLEIPTKIPNPATFAIELGDKVSDSESGLIVRLYSQFPFPNRARTGGPQDEFERLALRTLQADPDTPVLHQEALNGIETVRYAEAVTMQQSCVDCHNTHPASPKRNWRVGDVRGVLEITQPLYGAEATFASTIRFAYQAFSGLAVVSLFSMLFAVRRVFSLSKRMAMTSEQAKTLDSIAHTDDLTGIPNRRAFENRAKEWVDILAENEEWLSILLFDLDHFKQINDTYGHDRGDQCLVETAKAISFILRRADDFVARYGGEEFVVLLPRTREQQAFQVAERMRVALSELRIGEQNIAITASFGIASSRPKNKGDLKAFGSPCRPCLVQCQSARSKLFGD